ncbi:MAG: hypothetical protein IPL43_06505 [Micropruina sp.]|nr:hypothetical protein [Micropruina sp.]
MSDSTDTTTSVKLPPQPMILVILAGLGMVGPFSIDTIVDGQWDFLWAVA